MEKKAILVGVDGSTESDRAIEWALNRAQELGSSATLLTVIDEAVANKAGVEVSALEDSVVENLAQKVVAFCEKFPEVQINTEVKVGKVDKVFAEVGRDYSLLVLGKAENGANYFFGRTPSLRISANSDVPCVVVPAGFDDKAREFGGGIVVGVGAEVEVSGPAIVFAAEEALSRGATLHLVSAWGLPSWLEKSAGVLGGGTSAAGQERERELSAIAKRLIERYPGLKVERHCIEGASTAHALESISKEAAMLVLGTNSRSLLGRALYGSPTYETLLKPKLPVVVVPPRYGARKGVYEVGEFTREIENDYVVSVGDLSLA